MKCIALVHKNLEDISAAEIFEIIGKKGDISETAIIFDANDEEVCTLCYRGQSFFKLGKLIGEKEIKKIEDVEELVKKIDFFSEDKSFVVRLIKKNSDLESMETEKEIGGFILKHLQKNNKFVPKVDFKEPDYTIVAYVNGNRCYMFLDYSVIDLSKRDYKIFSQNETIKGTTAYNLLKFSGYDKKKKLLDCFCGSGTIPIEAALYKLGMPVNYYRKEKLGFSKFLKFDFEKADKKIKEPKKQDIDGYDHLLKNLKNSEKNAKIAGVEKAINFTKIEVDALDIKLKKDSFDLVVANPPRYGKREDENKYNKLVETFFLRVEWPLKMGGKIGILTNCKEKYISASKEIYKLEEERDINIGDEKLSMLRFVKVKEIEEEKHLSQIN